LSFIAWTSLRIDEADLVLSYVRDEHVRQILCRNHLPKLVQSFLISATITKDVEALNGILISHVVHFLMQFSIQSCVQSPDQPLNSRLVGIFITKI